MPERQLAVRLSIDLVALLVDRAVVPATEHGEVRQRRGAAVGPVTDVMALAEPDVRSPGSDSPGRDAAAPAATPGGIVRVRAPTSSRFGRRRRGA